MSKPKEHIPVLRVSQLDTQELDESLLLTLKQSISQDFFKYVQYNFFQKYHTEIFTAVKLLLWYNTFYTKSQTVGQSILEWSYSNDSNRFNKLKKLAHCLFYCFDELFYEKFPDFVKNLVHFIINFKNRKSFREDGDHSERFQLNRKIEKCLKIVGGFFKITSFINYLVFLTNGKYLHLWERVLNLRPNYNREQLMKSYNHEISEREELWQTYFSLFKLIDSLINFNKIFTKINKIRNRKPEGLDELNIKSCPICEKEPTMVHCSTQYDQLGSCKHVFCYICIKKALDALENGFECPICKKTIRDIEFYIAKQNE